MTQTAASTASEQVKGGTTTLLLKNMGKNVLCLVANAQGLSLSPADIDDKNPNLNQAVRQDALSARAVGTAKNDPTHQNLMRMNRFDEYCNTLAAAKATYDLYKRLQERVLPLKSDAIANHDSYEALLKDAGKQLEHLQKTLTMLATNIVNDAKVTPEAKEQILYMEQERKKFIETTAAVTKGAEKAGVGLEALTREAREAALGKTSGPAPSASPDSPG
jgi:hypothetical protein